MDTVDTGAIGPDKPFGSARAYHTDTDSEQDQARAKAQPCQDNSGLLLGVATTIFSPTQSSHCEENDDDHYDAKGAEAPSSHGLEEIEGTGERRQRTEDKGARNGGGSARKSARIAGEPPPPDMGPMAPRSRAPSQGPSSTRKQQAKELPQHDDMEDEGRHTDSNYDLHTID